MKQYLLGFSIFAAYSMFSHAESAATSLSQSTQSQVNPKTVQAIQNSLRPSPQFKTAPAATIPTNLPAMLYKSSTTDIDNQRAYHAQIKEYLKSKKK